MIWKWPIATLVACMVCVSATKQQAERGDGAQKNEQGAATTRIPVPNSSGNGERSGQGCQGTDKPNLTCDAISAQAALEQATDADTQLSVSLFQAILGALTLAAAAFAAKYARDAARFTNAGSLEAKRSADAGEKSIEETKRIGEAQVRAYVQIRNPSVTLRSDGTIGFELEIENVGQSPALDIKATYLIEFNRVGALLIQQIAGDVLSGKTTQLSISNKKRFTVTSCTEGMNTDVYRSVKDQEFMVMDIITYVRWKDVFGHEHGDAPRFAILRCSWEFDKSFEVPDEHTLASEIAGEIYKRRHRDALSA